MTTVKMTIQQAISQASANLKETVKDFKGLVDVYYSNKNEQQLLTASLGLTALRQVLNGNLSGLFAFLEIAHKDKLDVKGFKQFIDDIGLKAGIQYNEGKTGYGWKKGYRMTFFTLEIQEFLTKNGYDENDKVIISNHLFGDIFPYAKPKPEDKTLTNAEAVLKLAATLATFRKDKQVELTILELQQALQLSQYATVKERKDSMTQANQASRGLAITSVE